MKSKMILMNGPLNIGKDVAMDNIISKGLSLVKRECKDKLHELTIGFFNVSEEFYWDTYDTRATKELPLPEFKVSVEMFDELTLVISAIKGRISYQGYVWLSVREAMILVSEVICKPTFGRDYFGVCRANNINSHGPHWYYDGSAGFSEELPPLIEKLGQENILLLKIYRDGYGFEPNDSRGYLSDNVIDNTVEVFNNGTLKEYLDEVEEIVLNFIVGGE